MIADERTITVRRRRVGELTVGYLGPVASCFTLAWLASHRGRLRSFLLGGRRLSLLVMWDDRGAAAVDRVDADLVAIEQLTYGRLRERS